MTDEREWIKMSSVESACRIPPSFGPRTLSLRWLKLDLSSKRVILGFLCLLLAGNSIFYFVVPSESDEMILEAESLGIVDNLKVAFHTYFAARSQNQSVEISLLCSEGSIDLVVLESTEWESWHNGSEYTALYELTNTTFVDTVIQINPLYRGSIDIVISTTYGYVTMNVNMHSRSITYDDTTVVFSLFGAVSLVLVWIFYHNRTQKTVESSSIGVEIT